MNIYKQLSSTILILLAAVGSTFAQNDLRVPVSNPGEPGTLKLYSLYSDEITIKAHSDKDILFVIDGEDDEEDMEEYGRDGLRRISRQGGGLEVSEAGNIMEVRTSSHDEVDLEIWLPENFSIQVHLTHGDLYVDGLTGEHEVKATNGDIEMTNMSGSCIVNSVNGDILVEFKEVYPNAPMSFTGLNGDVEVSLPADVKFNGKMKTDYGDVYTNFEIVIDRSSNTSEISETDGTYTVVVNKWITGSVNGGGPEYLFKTLHGDIEIRKN